MTWSGARWSYSNTNYVLAGLLIEAVTGHSYADEVTQRILRQGRHQVLDVTRVNPSWASAAGPAAAERLQEKVDTVVKTALCG